MKFLYIFTNSIYGHFFSTPLDLTPYLSSWTVVTGCTDGIGRAYVEELARARGVRRFYLIGRNAGKLERVKREMTEAYEGCEIRTAVFDFEKDDFDKLPKELGELNVGILINCAGIAPERVGNFSELPQGLASKIFRVNLMSNIKMIETVLPGMLRRDLGIVVNIASMTGWRPLPYMSSYPASKAAISFFSDSLADEFGDGKTNVHVQCLIPLLVATKIASYDASEANNIWVVDVKTFARQAVRLIGNYRISTGCFPHDMQIAFGTLLSFSVFKQLFVPLVLLGVHRKRVERFQTSRKERGEE